MSVEAMPPTPNPVVEALTDLTDAVRGLNPAPHRFNAAEREQLAEIMHRANDNAPSYTTRWTHIADAVADYLEGK